MFFSKEKRERFTKLNTSFVTLRIELSKVLFLLFEFSCEEMFSVFKSNEVIFLYIVTGSLENYCKTCTFDLLSTS